MCIPFDSIGSRAHTNDGLRLRKLRKNTKIPAIASVVFVGPLGKTGRVTRIKTLFDSTLM